jgi:hypothetical protein
MGRFQTRDEITELVRSQYDLPTLSASTNPTAGHVTSFIAESLQQMYGMLMECYGDDYFGQSYTLTTTASVGTSSLPQDFHKLISMSWRRESGIAIPIRMATADEAHKSTLAAVPWSSAAPKYRLTSSAVQWCPVPSEAYVVDLWYVAIPSDLALGGDVVSVGPGWVQWVVHDVCVKIATRLRDGETRAFFAQLRDDAEKRLREQAPARSESEAHGVRAVTRWGKDPFATPSRTTGTSGSSPGVTDHGQLTGLGDDDHPQYLLRSDYASGGAVDRHYAHTQSVAASTWIVNHGLGKYPSVTVVDSAGDECLGDVRHNGLNQTTLTFSAAFSGAAYFN